MEVGAGAGAWTLLLRNAGLDVVGTDLPGAVDYSFKPSRYGDVVSLGAVDAVRRYPERNLFCSWPSQDERWIADAIALLAPGRVAALILDDRPGMTGPQDLETVLSETCLEVGEAPLPQFPNVYDRLRLFRRR